MWCRMCRVLGRAARCTFSCVWLFLGRATRLTFSCVRLFLRRAIRFTCSCVRLFLGRAIFFHFQLCAAVLAESDWEQPSRAYASECLGLGS